MQRTKALAQEANTTRQDVVEASSLVRSSESSQISFHDHAATTLESNPLDPYDIASIVKNLSSRGIAGIPHGKLIGKKSGIIHEFSIVIIGEKGAKPLVVSYGSGEVEFFSFFAKSLDAGAKGKIFVAIPKVKESTKIFAESYGISIFEAGSPHDVLETLPEKISQIIQASTRRKEGEGDFKIAKRSSFDIIADILTIAEKPISKTEILYRANLSFKQAQKYLAMLEKMGLLKKYFVDGMGRRYVITEKGKEQLFGSFEQFGRISDGSNSIWEKQV